MSDTELRACRHGGKAERYRGCRGCHRDRADHLSMKLTSTERDLKANISKLEAEVLANAEAEANRKLRARNEELEQALNSARHSLSFARRNPSSGYYLKTIQMAEDTLRRVAG